MWHNYFFFFFTVLFLQLKKETLKKNKLIWYKKIWNAKQKYFYSKNIYIYICIMYTSATILKEWELKWKSESENVNAGEKKRTYARERTKTRMSKTSIRFRHSGSTGFVCFRDFSLHFHINRSLTKNAW